MSDSYERAPKVELHLHLEGATPKSALWQLIERHGDTRVGTPEELDALFEYRDFPHFIETWQWFLPLMSTAADFTLAAEAVARSLADQDIVYAEASISPTDFRQHGLSVADIAMGVRRGLDRVHATHVSLLVDLVRDQGPERGMRTLEQTIEVADEAGVVGITIGGSEADHPPGPFADVYRRAETVGLGLSAHAGEAAGPASVWSAIDELGVHRVGHGIRSVEDPALVKELVRRRMPLEICPTSNLRTGVVSSWTEHPVIELIEAGAVVTINSDDPTFFESSVAGDMREIARQTDFDMERHTRYAIESSFADSDTKARLAMEVSAWWAEERA